MIDLHTHVLSALDDGPPDLSGSLEVARAAEAAGTRVLVATPHVNGEYQVTSEVVASGVRSLNAAICDAGVQVTVRPGAEVALWRALELPDDELVRLRLGGAGCWSRAP